MDNGLRQDEVDNIKNKRWQLDCHQMRLTYNDSNYFIEGAGYIRMEPATGMSFKIYQESSDWFTHSRNRGRHSTLTANDADGRKWEATTDHVNVPSANAPISGKIMTQIKGVSNSQHKSEPGHLSFICFDNHEFPFSLIPIINAYNNSQSGKIRWSCERARFSVKELDFALTEEEDRFLISITSKTPSLPSNIETRAIETLTFLLGCVIDWRILEKHENGIEQITVRCVSPVSEKVYPPLAHRDPVNPDHWQLYAKYFEYVCKCQDEKRWHQVSIFIRRILEASKASSEIQCLVLGVAIEGLLKTEFGDLPKQADELFKWIEPAKEILNQSQIPPNIAKRMSSVIDGMQRPRAEDQLQELVNQAVITKKEKDTWSKLRHSSAHPKQAFVEDIKKSFDKFDTVLTLFYKLIFHRIGYYGKYTDYGTPDRRDADFPAKSTMAPPTEK